MAARPPALTGSEAAWLAVAPCAVLVGALVAVLGPALGAIVFPAHPGDPSFWPRWLADGSVRPEPTEHARYLLALTTPLLISGALLLAVRRRWAWGSPRVRRAVVLATQALVMAFLLGCVVAQRSVTYGALYMFDPPRHRAYFTWTTLGVALAIAGLLASATRRRAWADRIVAWRRDVASLRISAGLVATLLTATWLLTALNVEGTIGNAHRGVRVSMPFWLDETFAVLNGQAPLVDFHAQYSQLWPYATAAVMSLVGASVGAFSTIMVLASAAALLCVFATFRRVVRSSLVAVALYVPFVSTSFFTELGPLSNRYGPMNLFSEFPMRYGGPYVLAWLLARHLDGARPRRRALLFLLAGVVVVGNLEFGVAAFGATLAAILWTQTGRAGSVMQRVLRDVAAGLLGTAVLTCLLTLAVAGSLPRPGLLLEFPRLYGIDGFGMLPMPTLGLHLVVYATFVAALVVATVRAVRQDRDAVLTGMLAWSGVFGLGVGGYFVGRSHPEVLIDLFSAWAFALVLLVVVTVRAIQAHPGRWPQPAQLAVLGGFALAICSVAQTPAPWTQIARLGETTQHPALRYPRLKRLVAGVTRPGEPVAILNTLGHRVAYDIHRENVSPYVSIASMPTAEQLDETVARLRSAGGRLLFLDYEITVDEVVDRLVGRGFELVRTDASGTMIFADRGG